MNVFEGLVDARCVGCRSWGTVACDRCVARWTADPIYTSIGHGIPVHAVGGYRGGLRSVILAAKHRGAHALVRRLGGAIRELTDSFDADVVVPIPSSRPGFLARGYGLASVVANTTLRRTVDCLVLNDTGSQRGRQRSERQTRSMHVSRHRLSVGTRVLLVDDVFTTGTTVSAAIAACRDAGFRVVGVVVLAVARQTDTLIPTLPINRVGV